MRKLYILLAILCAGQLVRAQQYAIVIKGGHVIDPKNNIDEVMDIAIDAGKIADIAKNIDGKRAVQVVDASGCDVTPGLIDINTHGFYSTYPNHTSVTAMTSLPP